MRVPTSRVELPPVASTAPEPTDRTGTRPDVVVVATIGLLALPLLIAIGTLVGEHWHPVSDLAIEVLGIRDVGGRHTPLVGVQSRFGYFHPGPLLFWVLAPFDWVLGTTGLLVGSALLNAAAIIGCVFVALRRGRAAIAVLVGLAAALLCRGMGPELLVEPWNPWVVVMPFFLYALLAWSVADGDWPTLPWLVGVGSFVVQAHVGYAPLVLALGATAGTLAALGASRRESTGEPGSRSQRGDRFSVRRWLVLAAVVGVVLWIPPVVQQLTGSPGNLGEIVDALRHPQGPQTGWADGFGIMGRQLSPVPPFIAGSETDARDLIGQSSTLPAIGLVLAAAVLGALAWRRGAAGAGRLAILGVVAAGVSVISASRVTGLPVVYLVRWAWVVAAFVWVSILWSLWSLIPHRRGARMAVLTVFAVTAVVSIATAWQALPLRPPQHQASDAIGSLGSQAEHALDHEPVYRLDWVDVEAFGATGLGMFADLEDRGVSVRAPTQFSHALGSWRTARASEVDGVLTLVAGSDLDAGWQPPADAKLVASFDPLDRTERARFQRLQRRIREEIGADADEYLVLTTDFDRDALAARGADPEQIQALWRLSRDGDRYRLYLEPT